MTLSVEHIERLVARHAPVLCVDTCTLLDVMRDITRDSIRAVDIEAGMRLLQAVEIDAGPIVLMADQVRIELNEHQDAVGQEAEKALVKFRAQIERVDEVAAVFGAAGTAMTKHLDDHVPRARSIFDRWVAKALVIPPNDGVTARAFARVNEPRTPAVRGKESMKDCVVVEAYLQAVGLLRAAGLDTPVVFASSNTNEYYGKGSRQLAQDIAADFEAVSLEYAPNLGAARHLLGLR